MNSDQPLKGHSPVLNPQPRTPNPDQALEEYSADAMRFALALAGDSNEDANFEHTVANAAILKLTTELAFIEKSLASVGEMRTGPIELFVDRVFENEINR
jgi:leucyl-tRNA synthetase